MVISLAGRKGFLRYCFAVSRTVLIVDGDSPLGRSLVRRFREAGDRVVATRGVGEKPEPGQDGTGVVRAGWSRASPVSARNVMLSALTAHDRLDMAVFVFTPSLKRLLLHETDYTEIESALDEHLRGALFLLREVLGRFVRQGGGALALVHGFVAGRSAESPPLEAAVRGGISELTSSILASYDGEGVSVYRFETESPAAEEYAGYVFDTLCRKGRRPARPGTYVFRERTGLLERLPFRFRREGSGRAAGDT